jgi:hypothetical protein
MREVLVLWDISRRWKSLLRRYSGLADLPWRKQTSEVIVGVSSDPAFRKGS